MEPVIVLTTPGDVEALAMKSPRAAAAAREFFVDAPPGRAVVVTWHGTGKRRSYSVTLAMTARAFAVT